MRRGHPKSPSDLPTVLQIRRANFFRKMPVTVPLMHDFTDFAIGVDNSTIRVISYRVSPNQTQSSNPRKIRFARGSAGEARVKYIIVQPLIDTPGRSGRSRQLEREQLLLHKIVENPYGAA